MKALLEILYNSGKAEATQRLYKSSDDSERLLIRSVVAQALKDRADIISGNGADWILCTLCQFERDGENTIRVLRALMRYIGNDIDVGLLNKQIEYKGMDEVADSCLVGVSIFREYIKRRSLIEYYSRVGMLAFDRLGYSNIANEFDGWVEFLRKELTILEQ
jgi:hypothetical protein